MGDESTHAHELALTFAKTTLEHQLQIMNTPDQRELLATYARDYLWAKEYFEKLSTLPPVSDPPSVS